MTVVLERCAEAQDGPSCSISAAPRRLGVGIGPADEKATPDDATILNSSVLMKIDTCWQKSNKSVHRQFPVKVITQSDQSQPLMGVLFIR